MSLSPEPSPRNSASPASTGRSARSAELEGERRRAVGNPTPDAFQLAIFDDTLRSVPLAVGTILVGRSKHNHLQLKDHLLSRKHCSLTLAGGRLILADLNSANGTYVNGEKVETCELQVDDIIELGKTVMVVFDGDSWKRGQGMMNLRNPLKAQELVQLLSEGRRDLVPESALSGRRASGVRPRKGISEEERAFLRWLERDDGGLLSDLVTEYLTHKLISLLVRNSRPVRSAFTTMLEEMMRPEFFGRFERAPELKAAISELVRKELRDLRADAVETDAERDLLEPRAEPLEVEERSPEIAEETPGLTPPEDLPEEGALRG